MIVCSPQAPRDPQRSWTPAAKRRPKEFRIDPGRVENRLLCLQQLAANFRGRSEDQVGMVPGVDANGVSGFDHCPRDLRPLLYEAPDEEKRRLHLMTIKHLHHLLGVGIVGTIVERQRQLTRPWFQANERPPI